MAIRQVLQGRVYLTPGADEGRHGAHGRRRRRAEPSLTPRQRDVLRLIVKGMRMKEVAAELGLSTRTVEAHKYEMMEVLGLHSTAELVRYALDRRLALNCSVPQRSWSEALRMPDTAYHAPVMYTSTKRPCAASQRFFPGCTGSK